MKSGSIACLLVATILLGCAGPATPGRQTTGNEDEAPRVSGPKRIVVGIRGTPASPVMKITVSGGTGQAPGAEELEELVNARLGMVDPDGRVRPHLAASVPTANDNSWTVLPSGGGPVMLESRGYPIGLTADGYEERAAHLGMGDRLYLYSDGVPEAMDPAGRQFGEARLMDMICQCRFEPVHEGTTALLSEIVRWHGSGGPRDDISILAVEVSSLAGP